jgi:quercetin dioxygenase-like cupin family protein
LQVTSRSYFSCDIATDRKGDSLVTRIDARETMDVFGPRVNFLSSLDLGEAEFTLIAGAIDPGVIVPLHSHPDRELFSLSEGSIEAFVADQWHTMRAGDVLDIRDGVRHAWRNVSEAPARLLIVTTVRMGHFLREIGRPLAAASAPPSLGDIEKLISTSIRYSYWNGSPEDNAAIGLSLPRG